MTRRDLFEKWFLYGLALFPIWVVDCYLLSRYPIYGVTPMLLPLTVAAVATLEGQMAGGAFGIWVGFVWQTTYPDTMGLMILLLTLFGYCSGAVVQNVLKRGFFGYFVSTCSILLGVQIMKILLWLIQGKGTAMQLVPFALKEIILSLIYTPIVYWIFQRTFQKVLRKVGKS